MSDEDGPGVGSAAESYELPAFRLNSERLPGSQSYGQCERLASSILTKLDSRDQSSRHLPVNFLMTVHQDSVKAVSLNETGKLGIIHDQLLAIGQSHDHSCDRRGYLNYRLEEQGDNQIEIPHHSRSTPSAMPIPPLIHSV